MTQQPRTPQVACPLCRVGIAQQEPDLHLTGDCGCACHRPAETGLREAAQAVLDHAEPDDNFEGEYIDWLVPHDHIATLRAALESPREER